MRTQLSVLFILMLAFKLNAQHNVKFTGIALKGDSVLSWTVTNVPEDPFIYIIQQYRWNSWVDLDTIYTLLKTDTVFRSRIKRYEITGENKFRVRAVGNTMLIYSKALTFNSNRPSSKNIEGRYNKKSPTIQFGREELYRIYDKNGKMLKQGYAREVSVGELPKDVYYINYGERTGEFIIY